MSAGELMRRFKPWLDDLPAYVPGKPAVGAVDGKLSSNESPVPPPESVLRAVAAAATVLNRYPDPLARGVTTRLAARLGVGEQCLLAGNGSDELIYLLATACFGPGARVVVAEPPYLVHEIASLAAGAEVVRVPLAGYRHDLAAMARVPADAAFIANPHNPTGTAVGRHDIEAFLRASQARLVVVDEAYIDFADDPDALSALALIDSGRVVVLRTFSKLYGLAGARIGYMAGPGDVVETLKKLRAPFSVNSLAQAAAAASLDQPSALDEVRDSMRALRERMAQAFRRAGYEVIPSQANFVLVKTPDETALLERLAGIDISARPGSVLGMPGHVRVSVGPAHVVERLERELVP